MCSYENKERSTLCSIRICHSNVGPSATCMSGYEPNPSYEAKSKPCTNADPHVASKVRVNPGSQYSGFKIWRYHQIKSLSSIFFYTTLSANYQIISTVNCILSSSLHALAIASLVQVLTARECTACSRHIEKTTCYKLLALEIKCWYLHLYSRVLRVLLSDPYELWLKLTEKLRYWTEPRIFRFVQAIWKTHLRATRSYLVTDIPDFSLVLLKLQMIYTTFQFRLTKIKIIQKW